MEFTTYMKENNVLILTNDEYYLVFKWSNGHCIVARCNLSLTSDEVDTNNASIVFAWMTNKYNLEEIKLALYYITKRAFDISLDENYDPIFTEWVQKDLISVSYHYDALYEEFNK